MDVPSPSGAAPPPFASPPPVAKKRGALFWILLLGGAFALCCGGIGACVLWKGADFLRIAALPASQRAAAMSAALMQLAPAETAAVDTYFEHLGAARDHEAWGMTSSVLRSATTRKQYDDLAVLIRTVVGPCVSKTLVNLNTRTVVGAASTTEFTYQAQFEKGPGTISVTTETTGGVVQIRSFRVESPLFLDAMTRGAEAPK